MSALEDYTTDQRGDVGSWVRTAAVLALGRVIGGAATAATPADLVSQEQFDAAISGIVKQALEKLQVVRDASTTTWAVLLEAKADKVWDWPAANVFATAPAPTDPRHTDQWFSAGLEVFRTRYRPAAVSGILQSAGGSVSSVSTAVKPRRVPADTPDGTLVCGAPQVAERPRTSRLGASRRRAG